MAEMTVTNVHLAEGATEVADYEFRRRVDVKAVELHGVTKVGQYAFDHCRNLETVNMPQLARVEESAFNGCWKLERVDMPQLARVGESAFNGCWNLETVDMPQLTHVGERAFYECESLETVDMPQPAHAEKHAFAWCTGLESVDMPQLAHVGGYAFYQCRNLETVNMPQLAHVGEWAFAGCGKLERVAMRQLAHVGAGAFDGCGKLERVELPQLAHVGGYAFDGCVMLERVDMPQLAHVGRAAFHYCRNLESAALPITAEIDRNAFIGCDPARLAIRFVGVLDAAADLDRPNAFPALNQYTRTAAVAHRLDGAAADTVVVARTWPASTDQLTAGIAYRTSATHAGTAAGPATAVVDATGIVSPIPLQDLGGNQFPVHGCWSDGPGADFKALAAAQHPEQLGDPAGWAVLVGDEADEPSDTVDLADVALRLARGELTLAEPWLLVWKPVEGAEGGAAVADSDTQGGADGEAADGRRVRAKLAV